jgi:hypothetical protein
VRFQLQRLALDDFANRPAHAIPIPVIADQRGPREQPSCRFNVGLDGFVGMVGVNVNKVRRQAVPRHLTQAV